ncbi:cadmium ion transporter [Crucibulum laeve]|uniref:Cadmium ion transporter n=1 Tax=Crucibulum laeve TaxID=68775 RepID=A0A5C3LSZ2_9AGAR|nr:cadmium ion transporter [Crucibulum laeve]
MKIHNPFKRPPAAPGFGSGKVLPEVHASYLSKLIFSWLGPFLDVGFSRPLEKDDFWELPNSQLTNTVTDKVEANFYARCPPEKRPNFLRNKYGNDAQPAPEPSNEHEASAKGKASKPQYDESLFKSLHHTFFREIWVSGALKLFSDTLKTTTPLLNKLIFTWLTQSYVFHHLNDAERTEFGITQPRGLGYGIGLAFALFVMQEVASLMTNHFMQISMTVGLSVRTAIIGNIFRKSLRLSGRARVNHSVGQITTMISTDATRLDVFAAYGHNIWVAPIQLAIGIGLLIGNLGYSALVGLGVLILGFPIQMILVVILFTQAKKGVKITDKRVRLTTEVLQGIRLLKFYAWEAFYIEQIGILRALEIARIKKSAIATSLLVSMVNFIPVIASVLSFITYALSGHELNVAIIFSSLQLFNIIRAPMIFLPFVLSSLSDALVALERIKTFLTAEELAEPYKIRQDETGPAVDIDGDFAWETVLGRDANEEGGKFTHAGKDVKDKANKDKSKNEKKRDEKAKEGRWWSKKKEGEVNESVLPTTIPEDEKSKESHDDDDKPFELKNLKFTVPKGAFIGIVGRVGCGKSSVLQALIGEMRRTRGDVTFGGSVAYVPQAPWIRNATVRQNILFGQDDDETRFREVVRACNLEHDLQDLAHREETEIGEKGINLSGGQKARVSLARAAYSPSEIVLLDDPLSAVDAYVGKYILENCLLSGPLANRTRILVTHALHVLDKTDYIYVMDNGAIIAQGTYEELMTSSIIFSRLIEEYGKGEGQQENASSRHRQAKLSVPDNNHSTDIDKTNAVLMQLEEREVGAVPWEVYKKYLRYAGGLIWAPIILLLLILDQGSQVATTLFLGFWTAGSIHGFKQGDYMAVYVALGVAQATFSFLITFAFAFAGLIASLKLFRAALAGVLRSPTSFFDTTPMGRILSRLSKDQETLDTMLAMTMMQFLTIFASVIGTAALVFRTFPLLGIIFAPMVVLYYMFSVYYRRTSVETKRLDSLLRSALYGSYAETLTGLSTIRAYREQLRSVKDAESGLDMENRAYYMTISIQRWLAVRLDFFGNILLLGIGLFAAGFRNSVDPSKIGVVLTYTLGITQVFSEMISQFAQNEQNMNSVERVLHYADLPPEADTITPNDPPASWPEKGDIEFTDVELSYREGQPLVLKGVSFHVRAGEKVGIVGRTGAGKTSLLQALFRTVELQNGKISIDGIDISGIGMDTLRRSLALVPQDSTLFLGTLRDNLDPQRLRTDAELITVLQRAWLLPRDGSSDPAAEAKFSLDSTVGDEGSNFSAGEKQLLALSRALVKNSRIIVLDEATSSVDVETDAKLQRTIQTEFASSTLLCIAHRLNTIAYYDRVLVMDGGQVAEFDTVLNLFDKQDSIFRSLCDEAKLQRADIIRIRTDYGGALKDS